MITKVNNSYAVLNVAVKALIVIFSVWFLYRHIFIKNDVTAIKHGFTNIFNNSERIFLLFFVIALMFLNWGLEALKWRFLVKKIESLPFLKSFQAVFSGVTIGLFTPNRIGEYGGRVIYLKENNRWQGVLLTMVGNISQLIITLLPGIISLHLFSSSYLHLQTYITSSNLFSAEILLVLLSSTLTALFFNISYLSKFLKKLIPAKYAAVFSFYNKRELLNVFLMSLARYLVFSFQFFIILKICGVNLSLNEAVVFIPVTFLAISLIPSFAWTEIGVRGAVALFFLGLVSNQHLEIVTAVFILWLINIGLPAVLGLLGIYKVRLFRE